MNTCLALNQTQAFLFYGPTQFKAQYSPPSECCTKVFVESMGALAGKIDLWCSLFSENPTVTLSQQNESAYCKPTRYPLSAYQTGWFNQADNTTIKMKLIFSSISCQDVPPKPPAFLKKDEFFEFGLSSDQTANLSPRKFEMSTLRRSFTKVRLNNTCQRLTLLHRGKEANYASAICSTQFLNNEPSGGRGFIFLNKGDSFECCPSQKDGPNFPSYLTISYNSHFWIHLLDSNRTGMDASLKLHLQSYPYDQKAIKGTTSSSGAQNKPSIPLAIFATILAIGFSLS